MYFFETDSLMYPCFFFQSFDEAHCAEGRLDAHPAVETQAGQMVPRALLQRRGGGRLRQGEPRSRATRGAHVQNSGDRGCREDSQSLLHRRHHHRQGSQTQVHSLVEGRVDSHLGF